MSSLRREHGYEVKSTEISFSAWPRSWLPRRRSTVRPGPVGTGVDACAKSSRFGGFRDVAVSSDSEAWICAPVHAMCTAECTYLCTSSSSSESGSGKPLFSRACWEIGSGGRDRTYDQLINSTLHYQNPLVFCLSKYA